MALLRSLAAGLVAASLAFSAAAQQSWQEGQHYERLQDEVSAAPVDGIEVAEIFWYGCHYCAEFEPILQEWKSDLPEDVSFVLVPAPMSQASTIHARAYYAAKSLGVLDQVHDALYKGLAGEKRQLNSAASLGEYLADYGVDPEAFVKAFEAFPAKSQVAPAQSVLRGARVTGTPTLLVAGKYRTSPSMAGGYDAALQVVDYLLDKERGEATE